jgi:hypothetical protein
MARRLQVSMNDPFLVRGFQSLGNLAKDAEAPVHGETAAGNPLREGLSEGHLHHEILDPLRLLEAEEGRDVGVVQRSEKVRLPIEPRDLLSIAREELGQELQRHVSSERRIPSPVDGSHAAFAELLDDLVVAEPSPDHQRDLFTFSRRVAYILASPPSTYR